jgi:uncharacterized protein
MAVFSVAGIKGSPLRLTEEKIAEYVERSRRERRLADTIHIPPRTSAGFTVEKGQLLRVTCDQGPQVCDFNVFNRDDPRERFWSIRTRIVCGSHLTVGSQLWSSATFVEPLMTIVADTVSRVEHDPPVATHDLIFTRCDGRHYELVFKKSGVPNCQDNLAQAIEKFGLTPFDVHDPLNLFMTTGLNNEGRPFYLPSVAKKGDYVEMIADKSCIVAISACPGGSSGPTHHSLLAEVYNL